MFARTIARHVIYTHLKSPRFLLNDILRRGEHEQYLPGPTPRRAGGGNPLFSTCFSFVSLPLHTSNSSAPSAPMPDVTAVQFHEAVFELWLVIGEVAKGGMTGDLMYDTTVFSRRTATAIAASFTACLERVVTDPGVSLDDLDERIAMPRAEASVPRSLAPSAESAQSAVARLCDATERGAPADSTGVAAGPLGHAWGFLEAGVAAEAAETIASASNPVAAICDVGEGVVMTYADLELQARAVADMLQKASSQDTPRVSVLAPNGWGVLALHFATALAGGVVGNHNMHLVAPELAYQLERFEPHVIAVAGDALNAVADAALTLTGIGRSDSCPASFRLTVPWDYSTLLAPRVDRALLGVSPADPYMLYFTSGTSGKPKVGPGSYFPPRSHKHLEPSFIDMNCILSRGEQHLPGPSPRAYC